MFENCEAIVGEDGTTYNDDEIGETHAHYGTGGYLRHGTDRVIDPTPATVFCAETSSLHFYVTTTPVVRGGMFSAPGTTGFRKATRVATGERVTVGEKGIIPDWLIGGNVNDVTSVIIDSSFASVKSVSTAAWFYRCNALRLIDGLEYLDTSEATDMRAMFYQCRNLSSLDLSGFDTRKVTDMNGMFASCSTLESIFVSEQWNTDAVDASDMMFLDCYNLVGEDGTHYKASSYDKTRAHYGAGGYLRRHHSEYTVTIPPTGFTVFSADEPIAIPVGLEAFVCTDYNEEAETVNAVKLTSSTIPAGVGVLLKGTARQSYTMTALIGNELDEPYDDFLTDNLLVPATVPTVVSSGVMAYDFDEEDEQQHWRLLNFVLLEDKFAEVFRFIGPEADGVQLPANTAYLALAEVNGTRDGFVTIVWGNKFDVNGDGAVNVADVNVVTAEILLHPDGDGAKKYDVNSDDLVNVADVNVILAYILAHIAD